jgi:hypothetical protein
MRIAVGGNLVLLPGITEPFSNKEWNPFLSPGGSFVAGSISNGVPGS